MSPSPKRDYPIALRLTPLRSTPYPLRDTSSVTLDNLSPALEPNARLTRNQAYQQGIVLPPISSYLTYTNTLPLFSLLSAAFEPIERKNYWKSEQMDVSTAFFFGDVEEDIHVIHPLGLDDKIVRVLYGLEKAPRILSRKI